MKTKSTDITKRQQDVLNFMKQFKAEKGYMPTIREICKGINVNAPATVHTHFKELIKKGYIEKNEGNRAYRIVESISENSEEQAIELLNKIENRAHLTELEVKLYNQINKIDDILKSDYISMNIVVNDLKETLKVNNHIKQGENELICLDVDHINYLISTLEGKNKNDL